MSKPLQVWGMYLMKPNHAYATIQGQVRAIVATKSRAAAARAFNVPDSYLRDYGSITGNEKEIETALAKPGAVFVCSPYRLDLP